MYREPDAERAAEVEAEARRVEDARRRAIHAPGRWAIAAVVGGLLSAGLSFLALLAANHSTAAFAIACGFAVGAPCLWVVAIVCGAYARRMPTPSKMAAHAAMVLGIFLIVVSAAGLVWGVLGALHGIYGQD